MKELIKKNKSNITTDLYDKNFNKIEYEHALHTEL